ncbi:unnamed protein product, partial [Strongylus vulgaris]
MLAAVPAVPLLALKSPSGPPPQPPPRPLQRGHIRSASLDMMKQIQMAQAGIPFTAVDRRASDSTSAADSGHPLSNSEGGEGAVAPIFRSLTVHFFEACDVADLLSFSAIPAAVPPPIPQRVSPPAPIPRKTSSTEAQTDGHFVEAMELERFIADF